MCGYGCFLGVGIGRCRADPLSGWLQAVGAGPNAMQFGEWLRLAGLVWFVGWKRVFPEKKYPLGG